MSSSPGGREPAPRDSSAWAPASAALESRGGDGWTSLKNALDKSSSQIQLHKSLQVRGRLLKAKALVIGLPEAGRLDMPSKPVQRLTPLGGFDSRPPPLTSGFPFAVRDRSRFRAEPEATLDRLFHSVQGASSDSTVKVSRLPASPSGSTVILERSSMVPSWITAPMVRQQGEHASPRSARAEYAPADGQRSYGRGRRNGHVLPGCEIIGSPHYQAEATRMRAFRRASLGTAPATILARRRACGRRRASSSSTAHRAPRRP